MPFKKGQSGNPGGRPKEAPEVKELARSHTARAIERLAYWLDSDNAKASVAAALALLDRAWGRPTQAVEMTGKDGGPIATAEVSDIEVARWLAFTFEKARQEKRGATEGSATSH